MIHDQQLLYQRSFRASNLSDWLFNATLRNHLPTDGTLEAHHSLSLFAHEPQGWITLLGGVGTGKTHLLAARATNRAVSPRGRELGAASNERTDTQVETAPHEPFFIARDRKPHCFVGALVVRIREETQFMPFAIPLDAS
jgi:hypothetical protein